MKGMPLPFDFEGKGVLDFDLILEKNQSLLTNSFPTDFSPYFLGKNCIWETAISCNNSFGEPKSVLDSARFPSRPTSSSTLSSSHCGGGSSAFGGGGSTDTTNPSPRWNQQDSATATSCSNLARDSLNVGGERLPMEDWESVLSDVAPAAGQEQSVLRWIMGDIAEDPNSGLSKALQLGGGGGNNGLGFDFSGNNSGGFGVVDQESFSLGGVNLMPNVPILDGSNPISSNLMPNNLAFDSSSPLEMKLPLFNSQLLAQQAPSSMAFPLPYSAPLTDQNPFLPPQSKRHNPGVGVMDSSPLVPTTKGSSPFEQQPSSHLHHSRPHQLQFLPHYNPGPVKLGQRPNAWEDLGQRSQQQAIVDQLFKAAELVHTGNIVLAQGILARLNHQLSPISGKPFHRAAFYFKEAVQSLLSPNSYDDSSSNNFVNSLTTANSSPFSIIFKIEACKAFSEISPVLQFANFTCNQAILEALEGFDRIHVVDFDIGFGGQWASLMQELSLTSGGSTSLKITAFVSPSSHDQLELGLARENLVQFASEVNISFEFNVLGFDSLNPGACALPFHSSEAVVVNLPVGVLANSSRELSAASVLRFVKQLSPRIVVSVDKGCDRTDLPFANHVIHGLQSFSNLLESFDSVNASGDALQKIERFLLQPEIEKIVTNRFRAQEKAQHWRALLLSYGFSPINFSNFAESQAECIVKKTPVRGFVVEKRQSSLVLCWQRKELISASAWRC